jgi:hypothetical protein
MVHTGTTTLMVSQAEAQESQYGTGRRKIATADEYQGCQAWKRHRLGHGNNDCQLTAQAQFSSEHIPYTTPSSSTIQYNEHSVTGDESMSAACVRGNYPRSDFSSVGGQVLEDPPGNNAVLECCYGMVLLRDAVQK